jgi:hypothetical protein
MIEKITKTVYRCTCELLDCCGIDPKTGKPRPWDTQEEKIPDRCSWCKRRTWNHPDRRRKDTSQTPQYKWIRTKQCAACGGADWNSDAEGNESCAHCGAKVNAAEKPNGKDKRPTIRLPKPQKVRPPEEG